MTTKPNFWTTLPPLPLRGVGTGMVESIGYYALRLSQCTGISLHGIGALADAHHRKQIGVVRAMFALGAPSERFAIELEHLTGAKDLRRGTLWALNQVVGTKGSKAYFWRRWCPACYSCWDDSTSYEPLLWSLDVIDRCPIHGTVLESNCHDCGAKQNAMIRIDRRLSCTACRAPLGHPGRTYFHSTYKDWSERQAIDIVSACASPDTEAFDEQVYATYVLGLIENFYRQGRLPERLAMQLVHTRRTGQVRKPSLRTLIGMCALQGIDCRLMLFSPRYAACRPLLEYWKYCYTGIEAGRKRYGGAGDIVLWLLEELTATPRYLPPIEFVTHWMGVSIRAIRDMNVDAYWRYQKLYESSGTPSNSDAAKKLFRVMVDQYRANPSWLRDRDCQWIAAHVPAPPAGLAPETFQSMAESARDFVRLLERARDRTWFEQLDLFKEVPWLDSETAPSAPPKYGRSWRKRAPKW